MLGNLRSWLLELWRNLTHPPTSQIKSVQTFTKDVYHLVVGHYCQSASPRHEVSVAARRLKTQKWFFCCAGHIGRILKRSGSSSSKTGTSTKTVKTLPGFHKTMTFPLVTKCVNSQHSAFINTLTSNKILFVRFRFVLHPRKMSASCRFIALGVQKENRVGEVTTRRWLLTTRCWPLIRLQATNGKRYAFARWFTEVATRAPGP